MSEALSTTLFGSTTRAAVLELLFVRGVEASVSELARRSGLSPRSVGNEVRHLLPTGLVLVNTVGGADIVRANTGHVGASFLKGLLQTPGTSGRDPSEVLKTRESLVSWGAPLAGVKGIRHYPLNESLLRGLEVACQDGTVLRVLPCVLARHLLEIDWVELREDARRRKLKAPLGLLGDLTADLIGNTGLKSQVAGLHDRRRRSMRFFPEVKSPYEAELAKHCSPETAKRWGFWMNMSEDSFRSTLEKHGA